MIYFDEILKNKNSIGFLRLISAWLVVIGHSVPFGIFGEDLLIKITNNQLAVGRFPVDLFFVLSGFLIFSSYDRINNFIKFLWYRFIRIYPAYWVCIFLTAFVLAPSVGLGVDYKYFIVNISIILIKDFSIGEIGLSNNINSALWTLPWELKAYIIIGLLGLFNLLNKYWVIPIIFLFFYGIFIYKIINSPLGLETGEAITSGYRLFTFFFIGAVFYLFRNRIYISNILFVLSVFFIFLCILLGNIFYHHSAGFYYIFCPIPFSYIIFYFAYKLPFTSINTKTDTSYGVYIYGSIVLNVLTYLKLNNNYWIYLLLTIIITYFLSYLSWFLIEKKALNLKNKLFKN